MRRAAAGAAVLLLAACATVKPPPPAPVVEVPAMPAAPVRPPAPAAQPALPTTAPAPAPTATAPVGPAAPSPTVSVPGSRQVMIVESEPAGAIIVVNGRPVGHAPVRLDVPVTPQGFFRDDLEVRARFVARDETEVSRTATEEFNPRERVPAVVRFTPDGVKRTMVAPPADGAAPVTPAAAPR